MPELRTPSEILNDLTSASVELIRQRDPELGRMLDVPLPSPDAAAAPANPLPGYVEEQKSLLYRALRKMYRSVKDVSFLRGPLEKLRERAVGPR